jgi:hypothetical protein
MVKSSVAAPCVPGEAGQLEVHVVEPVMQEDAVREEDAHRGRVDRRDVGAIGRSSAVG